MYNDPSGELFWFAALAAAFKSVFWAGVVSAAIGGAIIGAGLYLGQAAITGNFSWGGLAKTFFGGAITGAVSGALGQVFSASGFWATVGNGALAGAGSGGVNAILNGTNFLEGIAKGAVIGGAIGAGSYGLGKLFQGKNNVQLNADGKFSYDGQQFANKEELISYIQDNNGDVKTIMKELNIKDIKLATPNDLPHSRETFYKLENGLMKEYSSAHGKITHKGTVLAKTIGDKSGSTIYVSPSLKGLNVNGTYIGKSILNHEFIHAKHISIGLTNKIFMERSAWSYNYAYAKYHNIPLEIFRQNVNRYGGFNIPSNYKWSKLGLEKFLRLF
ncbi:hypothetical protein [Bergeyella sp. RCAD1439]|uniref:hypothetical protein n=1 Tax=Bergeyella anatis TaxID=3113737 RepID=UPI002E1754F1|nr:hypothetical protein [Bergeyella sp. RCAD1439]